MKRLGDSKALISLISGIFILLILLSGCTTIDYALIAKSYTEEKGQHDEAIKNAKQGIALNPRYAPNWYWLGVAYFRKSNYDEAIRAFNRVVELRPAGDQFQSSYNFLGWAYYQKGNYDEAIRDLNKAIELKPTDSDSLRIRGWAKHHKGSFNEAVSDFNKALENIEPKDKDLLKDALRGKAFSYLGLGDKETALNLIKQAKSASDYDNNYDLSLIYYVTGDKEKAWEYRGGKGMVGVQIKDYSKGMIKGAEAVGIVEGSPAEKAGMLVGDIILKLNDADITGMMDFLNKAKTLIPGTIAKIKVLREGIEKDLSLPVASAEALMEKNPLIAPIIAKKKGKPETIAKLPQEVSPVIKSDVDELPSIKAKPNKNAYAIVIGIEEYRQKLPKADFAAHDAKTVSEYLTNVMGYSGENVVTLLNDHATMSDFVKYFEKWLPNRVEKGATIFVYYSGHGAPDPKAGEAYLVPYDGDPTFIVETGYPLKRLYESLGRLEAEVVIVALDSCFSGGGGRSVLAKGTRPLVITMDNSMVLSQKIAVLSASGGAEISSTYDEKGHGLFTYFMLRGLKGEADVNRNGSIEIGELFGYLKPEVERIARRLYNNEQTPQLIISDEKQDMILIGGQ
ncbi:MAG: tetratricopeptide repeat protein [Nitrospirae bacterium]|nr:tetratricopeptide repeat protein [Nitrospirota bacterium]